MREETEFRPKPMVQIGDRPILWHIMKLFSSAGFNEFVLCLGYRGNVIKDYFLNYEAMNNDFTIRLGRSHTVSYENAHDEQSFCVTLADTGQSTMTGGRIKRIRQYVGNETFLVTYGDGLADIDMRRVLEFHRSHGRIATMTSVQPTSRFGIVDISESSEVLSFTEKPQAGTWVNAGYMVFEPRIFDYLDDDATVLEREPLERLCRDGQLMAYRHSGFFYAMDTYRESQILNEMWQSGEAPWKLWS
jgi:glucose-1-phosphate cytidylyltransferase